MSRVEQFAKYERRRPSCPRVIPPRFDDEFCRDARAGALGKPLSKGVEVGAAEADPLARNDDPFRIENGGCSSDCPSDQPTGVGQDPAHAVVALGDRS